MFKFTSIFLLFFVPNLIAETPNSEIIMAPEDGIQNIGNQVYLLEDKEGNLTIEDILKPEYQSLFVRSKKEIPNFIFSKSKVWVKLTVINSNKEELFLELSNLGIWYIDFYKPDLSGNPILITKTGMMRPIENRELDNNFFLFELSNKPEPQTYYFSLLTDGPFLIPLNLGTAKNLFEYRYPYLLFFGMFSGLMLVMFMYNLFVYFSVRDKIYLYYCGYLFTGFFSFNFVSGNYGYKWNIITYFSNYFFVAMFTSAVFIILFILKLLKIQNQSYFYKISALALFITFVTAIINLITGRYFFITEIFQTTTFLYFVYVFFYSLGSYLKGNRNARFVIFGFSFHLLGALIFIAQNFELLSTNFFTLNSVVFGTSIEVLLFSFALADRINLMRMEKDESQSALLAQILENERLVKDQNQNLEHKIAERTKELNNTLGIIQKDLKYSQKIQQSILPRLLDLKGIDYAVLFQPMEEVGGDIYDFFAIKENRIRFFLADATGHGIQAALQTMAIKTEYENIKMSSLNPEFVLTLLNESIIQKFKSMYFSCLICDIDLSTKSLHYAAAGHPNIVFIKNKEFQLLGKTGSLIGLNKSMVYNCLTVPYQDGDSLYLFTDGCFEIFNINKVEFGEERFIKLLQEISSLPLNERIPSFQANIQNFRGKDNFEDDITLLAIDMKS